MHSLECTGMIQMFTLPADAEQRAGVKSQAVSGAGKQGRTKAAATGETSQRLRTHLAAI